MPPLSAQPWLVVSLWAGLWPSGLSLKAVAHVAEAQEPRAQPSQQAGLAKGTAWSPGSQPLSCHQHSAVGGPSSIRHF